MLLSFLIDLKILLNSERFLFWSNSVIHSRLFAMKIDDDPLDCEMEFSFMHCENPCW